MFSEKNQLRNPMNEAATNRHNPLVGDSHPAEPTKVSFYAAMTSLP
jgi:hypothetical protein